MATDKIRYEVITQKSLPDSDDVLIPIPMVLLQQLGWSENDRISLVRDNGKLILRKS